MKEMIPFSRIYPWLGMQEDAGGRMRCDFRLPTDAGRYLPSVCSSRLGVIGQLICQYEWRL